MKGCMSNFQLFKSLFLRRITKPDSATRDQESTLHEKQRLSIFHNLDVHKRRMRKPDLNLCLNESLRRKIEPCCWIIERPLQRIFVDPNCAIIESLRRIIIIIKSYS